MTPAKAPCQKLVNDTHILKSVFYTEIVISFEISSRDDSSSPVSCFGDSVGVVAMIESFERDDRC